VRDRTTSMERHLKAHPEDVDSWISYSTLHLRLSPELANRSVNASIDPLKLPQNRASAEVTLSILARGLEADPANFLSTHLHIAYLRAAEAFWPPEKITGRWKNVIRELGDRYRSSGKGMEQGMIRIWLGYIDWREGAGWGKSEEKGETGVDEVIEVYSECLEKLRMEDFGACPFHPLTPCFEFPSSTTPISLISRASPHSVLRTYVDAARLPWLLRPLHFVPNDRANDRRKHAIARRASAVPVLASLHLHASSW